MRSRRELQPFFFALVAAAQMLPAGFAEPAPPHANGQGRTGDHAVAVKAEAADERFAQFAREMDAGMQRMMHAMHLPGWSGNADADFLAMMIAHHEGAVEMARLELIHGRDPLTRQLAQEIIAAQVSEIEAMRARLVRLREGTDDASESFPALGATRGPAR